MLKNLFLLSVATISVCTLTGCASIVSGTQQKIAVSTGHVGGASCSFENNKGSWELAHTPGVVTVNRSYNDLKVHCWKPGYKTAVMTVPSNTRALAFGNVIFGGLIGAGIDVADGAAYHYPETILVPLYRG